MKGVVYVTGNGLAVKNAVIFLFVCLKKEKKKKPKKYIDQYCACIVRL